MRTYTGIELLQAIAKNEIKENTKFIDKYNINYIYKLDGIEGELALYKQEQYYEDSIPDYSMFIDNTFAEIKEEQDIDIQSIEEFEIDKNNYIQTELGAFKTRKMDIAFLNKINEIIQAVKQLDRKINQ